MGLAFSILGVGFAVNPGYHSATLSWTLIGIGILLLIVGAFQKRVQAASGLTAESFRTFVSIPIVGGCLLVIVVNGVTLVKEWAEGTLPNHDLAMRVDQLSKELHELETHPVPPVSH